MSIAGKSLVYVIAPIILFIGWLTFRQESFLFFPERLPDGYEINVPWPHTNVFLRPELEVLLHGIHIYSDAKPNRGAVLYFHGNAGSLRSWVAVAEDFLPHGYDIFIYDYRGFGLSRGQMSEFSLLNDARDTWNYMMQSYEPEDVILYGRSLGSAPATALATAVDPKMLILEAPFTSVPDLARYHYRLLPLPLRLILRYRLANRDIIDQVAAPIAIFHGDRDSIVPPRMGERLADVASKNNGSVRFISIEGGSHNDLSHLPSYQRQLSELLHGDFGRRAPDGAQKNEGEQK